MMSFDYFVCVVCSNDKLNPWIKTTLLHRQHETSHNHLSRSTLLLFWFIFFQWCNFLKVLISVLCWLIAVLLSLPLLLCGVDGVDFKVILCSANKLLLPNAYQSVWSLFVDRWYIFFFYRFENGRFICDNVACNFIPVKCVPKTDNDGSILNTWYRWC